MGFTGSFLKALGRVSLRKGFTQQYGVALRGCACGSNGGFLYWSLCLQNARGILRP